jgi:Arylsulfotransferase (ASST)
VTRRHLTRRELLIGGGGSLAGLGFLGAAGIVGYAWPRSSTAAIGQTSGSGAKQQPGSAAAQQPVSGPEHSFVTRSDLRPPVLSVRVFDSPAGLPPYIFLGNKAYQGRPVGQPGLMIAQRDGEIVWFKPVSDGQVLDFNVQSYKGKPVLTWWHGITATGIGKGSCYIADSSYSVIATVKAGHGLEADIHEFNLTDQGTALITAYRQRSADLSALGGKTNGTVWSGVVQEIDIATGDVVFQWDSLDHVPVTDTQQSFSGGTTDNPFDYFHINSIAVASDGNLLVSSRNTWTVYKIGRHDGVIRWRLGGKKSDFTIGAGARFYWQHHVRDHGAGLLTVFDNGSSPAEEPQSRGLLLRLDATGEHVTLERAYTNPAGLLADNQGSVQLLPDNRVFIGWGAEPYFTEYDPDGSILLNGQLPVGDQSYRAFTADWAGFPTDRPAVVVTANPARGSAVYVSWNGATEVATWRVLAGTKESSLSTVASQPQSGFETVISANSTGPYFAVTAHDAAGKLLGQSATVMKT